MNLFEGISRDIVCPIKMHYSLYDLGSIAHQHGKRQDFTCLDNKNKKIYASLYSCTMPIHPDICIVYLHSMNGSRLQSLTYVDNILKMGLSLCSFDFSGCGNSQGECISFGANQKYDIASVVEVLKQKFKMKKFVLWGRSMGSAAALKYCEYILQNKESSYKKQIISVVLDSCFKSFSKLAIQIGTNHSEVPECLVKLGYMMIKSSLQQKGQFKTDQLQLQDIIQKIDLPILFLASEQDTTVRSQHSKSLFDKAKHIKKELAYFKGAHNEARDNNYFIIVKNYIQKSIQYSMRPIKTKVINPLNSNFNNPKKIFVDDSIQFQQDISTCYCSLFSTNNQPEIEITDGVPTTRRQFSETNFYRAKSNKRQFQFRSTSNIQLNFK